LSISLISHPPEKNPLKNRLVPDTILCYCNRFKIKTNKTRTARAPARGQKETKVVGDGRPRGLGDLSLTQNFTLLLTVELHDILAVLCEIHEITELLP